ncbi:ATP-binding protein [Algoriphagus sp.]|uniref:ATP-binding protein n=1 Tax=Algoriphagus sp. TaxID=1872435 RepID=UPI0025D2F1C9|nr:ATP-binding protein [Algoriphagus sp.]
MKSEKDQLLQKAQEEILRIFTSEYPSEKMPDFISKEVSGFGTTKDERIKGFKNFREVLELQYQQSKEAGIEVSYKKKPFKYWKDESGDLALLVNEFDLFVKNPEGTDKLDFRLSSLFQWIDDSWKLIHWHGSTPVNVVRDAWHLTEWQKKNKELQEKVEEQTKDLTLKNYQLQKAKEQIEEALRELKEAQEQLIQSEKMASLGELTAGIAHEIQNPLNFVNNFSEVNTELLDELKEEIETGNIEEVNALVKDIIENEEKINFHGKRADAIVKGMLEHSRSSNGQKVPTDINSLADEYLRLSYHGLRAKDKTFNATLETDFDQNLPIINVVSQDIGRVILNLITNAFHSIRDRKNNLNGSEFNPTVKISTKNFEEYVEIIVSDNGNGIPESIQQKIFQPFFTTKPTGQGTGLGLSLSYDIIRSHGGKIQVESGVGSGADFKLIIPKN